MAQIDHALAATVPDGSDVTINYTAGMGFPLSTGHYVSINNNIYSLSDGEIAVELGETSATITNNTGADWLKNHLLKVELKEPEEVTIKRVSRSQYNNLATPDENIFYAIENDNITDNITISGATTKFDATASIDAAAILGIDHVVWTPGGDTVNTFVTGRQRMTTLDMGSGNDVPDPSHPVAGYDRLKIIGNGTCDLAFVHESKFENADADTNIGYLAFYKPSRDVIAGDVTNLVLYDADMDMTGVTGTVTNTYSFYQPRSGQHLMLQKGGIEVNAKLIVAAYELTRYDSGNRILAFAGTTINVTVPAALPAGFNCRVCQGDANKVTILASGGNTILNIDTQFKTEGILAVVDIDVMTSGSGGAVILSGRTSA